MEAQEILQDIFFVILYGVVMGLSVAAALYLLLRRSNAIAPGVTPPKCLRLWATAIMLLIPIIAGFLLSMLQDRHRPVWPVALALVPAVVLSTLGIICQDEAFMAWLRLYVIAFSALFMVFMFFAVRRYGRWLRDNYADLENKEVWQSFLILAVFVLSSIVYIFASEQTTFLIYLLEFVCIVIMGLLLWRVETLQSLSESAAAEAGEQTGQAQKAPQSIPVDLAALLKKHCENKHLYLQHDLSLSQLALAVGTNHYYLSQYFSQQGLTYNAYINGLRIRHFIRLWEKAAAERRAVTAQQLASESGYRSYSTFSAAFKQYSGKTVTSWMHDSGE